jgi:hypothetical protein
LVLVEFSEESGLGVNQRLSGFGGDRLVGFKAAVAANVEHGMAVFGEDATKE